MKIILDMNIPQIWESFFNKAGHEAIHWSKIGDIRAEDTEIMTWARENHYVVFTHGLDFEALLYATNAKSPSVIQLRVEHILLLSRQPPSTTQVSIVCNFADTLLTGILKYSF